jgi:hypothetical protein
MPYNLTPDQIVSSFSQAISSDFAVGAMDGYAVINQEIQFQYDRLNSYLSSDCLALLEKVPGEIVSVDLSGNFTPSLYAVEDTVQAYIIYKGYNTCGKPLNSCGCGPIYNDIEGISSASISGQGNNVYSLLDSFDKQTQYLVLYYDVSESLISPNSLKSILRDMVCGSLGSRLYPSGSDTWSIVQYYLDSSNRMLEKLEQGYMPADLKKIKLLNPVGGIRTVKVTRG